MTIRTINEGSILNTMRRAVVIIRLGRREDGHFPKDAWGQVEIQPNGMERECKRSHIFHPRGSLHRLCIEPEAEGAKVDSMRRERSFAWLT